MTGASFLVWQVGSCRVVAAAGCLDFASSVRLRLVLFDQLDDGARDLAVDLAEAELLDASAVGVLVRICQQVERSGGRLRVVGVRDLPRTVLEVTGAAKTLRLDDARLPPEPGDGRRPVDAGHGPDRQGWGDGANNLLWTIGRLPAGDPARGRLREAVIEECLPHARRLAHRFSGLGEPDEDLEQVAALGLLHAVNRFDPAMATDFASFAGPTIIGELKRYFRDHGWSVHVPRRLRELRPGISWARETLTQRVGHTPTTTEISAFLGLDEREVTRAVVAGNGYRATPLEGSYQDESPLGRLGVDDSGIEAVDRHYTLKSLIGTLPQRERRLVALRFFENLTQCEIANQLGISQMHVSRLLARTLSQLREHLRRG